jgi:hypothetical protein
MVRKTGAVLLMTALTAACLNRTTSPTVAVNDDRPRQQAANATTAIRACDFAGRGEFTCKLSRPLKPTDVMDKGNPGIIITSRLSSSGGS